MARKAVSEEALRVALIALKQEYPTLGVVKLHALLLETYPTWAVSEKRVRKILQSEGLAATGNDKRTDPAIAVHPVSRFNKSLEVTKWSGKIKVHHFSAFKGKGLVATERISEGEVVWKEDPFVLAPEWEIYDLQLSSKACAFCSTPLRNPSPLHLQCSASCPVMFCNRLCRTQSDKMALHALVQCTSKLLLSSQRDDGILDEDLHVVHGLAELGMEERFRALRDQGTEPDRQSWEKAHELYLCAFKAPMLLDEQKKLAKILKKPIPEALQSELFTYPAFLRGLGRMSLNLEAHGGLYRLHSHLNHVCTPNISVRHFDQHAALSRITVVAKTVIEPGEELLITYVDPRGDYKERRRRLLEWGFGPCQCERCLAEEKEASASSGTRAEEADELAEELKAGLGLL